MSEGVYLRTFLEPLRPWLEDPDVTDILINRPAEVWVERLGGPMALQSAPDVTGAMLQRLSQQIAAASHQGVNREYPLLAATLPGGARVQVAAPPATRGDIALAIRKHVVADLTLATIAASGAFAASQSVNASAGPAADPRLAAILAAGRYEEFLREAVRAGKTILVSGATGSGKTTFLNALLKETPPDARVIAIEDTPEVRLAHANAVGLVAVKGELGEARVSVDDLMQAALRMRPDRLLVGEVRGKEAFTFLRAIRTGHPGSITTVHAESPRGALEQIAFMALQSGLSLSRAEVIAYAHDAIDVIVQLARAGGARRVEAIAFNRAPS